MKWDRLHHAAVIFAGHIQSQPGDKEVLRLHSWGHWQCMQQHVQMFGNAATIRDNCETQDGLTYLCQLQHPTQGQEAISHSTCLADSMTNPFGTGVLWLPTHSRCAQQLFDAVRLSNLTPRPIALTERQASNGGAAPK